MDLQHISHNDIFHIMDRLVDLNIKKETRDEVFYIFTRTSFVYSLYYSYIYYTIPI